MYSPSQLQVKSTSEATTSGMSRMIEKEQVPASKISSRPEAREKGSQESKREDDDEEKDERTGEETDELEVSRMKKMKEEKKKRPRTAFTSTQIQSLEDEFDRSKYLSVSRRALLSASLGLTETQVYNTHTYLYSIQFNV